MSLTGADKNAIVDHLYKYVAAYQRQRATQAVEVARASLDLSHNQFVERVTRQLIEFVYEVIERGRRQAISEMLRICRRSIDGEAIRSEILKYLERSRFSERIEEILDGDQAGMKIVPSVLEEVRSYIDAAELRGDCARQLESYPDQPSLRILRAASEAMSIEPDVEVVRQNIEAAMSDGMNKYGLAAPQLLEPLLMLADMLIDDRTELAAAVVGAAINSSSDQRNSAKYMLMRVRRPLVNCVLALFLAQLVKSVKASNRR